MTQLVKITTSRTCSSIAFHLCGMSRNPRSLSLMRFTRQSSSIPNAPASASNRPLSNSSSSHKSFAMSMSIQRSRFVSWISGFFPRRTALVAPSSSSSNASAISKMDANAWEKSIQDSERLVNPSGESIINPKKLLGDDISLITQNISRLLGSGHPVLNTISHYYFSQSGKHIRPLIVLLMAHALNTVKTPPPPLPIDSGFNSPSDSIVFSPETSAQDASPAILPAQKRLAEITEMIHTASLLHDDVIDSSLTRRSRPSANAEYGNKMAILAGDFLLARASLALARLRNVQVVELLATVISNLVEGEFMQLRQGKAKTSSSDGQEGSVSCSHLWTDPQDDAWNQRFEYYMEKTYMKTASLIAKSCEATAVLGECSAEIVQASYEYGHHLGLAFQVGDDMLDFVVSAEELGKPANADLKLGLATAPVLYAAQKHPELYTLIDRRFSNPGDVELAHKLVFESGSLEKTRELAARLCQEACLAISDLPAGPAKTSLIELTRTVLTRRK